MNATGGVEVEYGICVVVMTDVHVHVTSMCDV